YYRNVYITNTDKVVQSGSESTITRTGTWKHIKAYAYTDQTPPAHSPSQQGDSLLKTVALIDGDIETAPEPIVDMQGNSNPPPLDLISRHIWDPLPTFEDGPLTDSTHGIGTFENVLDYGATATTTIDAIR